MIIKCIIPADPANPNVSPAAGTDVQPTPSPVATTVAPAKPLPTPTPEQGRRSCSRARNIPEQGRDGDGRDGGPEQSHPGWVGGWVGGRLAG